MVYFTSDTHFYHKNILKFENRPFTDVEDMNKCLIHNWNKKVKNTDQIYILGDFSFGNEEETLKLLNQLNGQKFLILGNHDHIVKKSKLIQSKFAWIKDYYMLRTINPLTNEKIKLPLFHYPIATWDCKHYGSIHLYGHVHSNKLEYDISNSYNVGVDVNNYKPISLVEILNKVKKEGEI